MQTRPFLCLALPLGFCVAVANCALAAGPAADAPAAHGHDHHHVRPKTPPTRTLPKPPEPSPGERDLRGLRLRRGAILRSIRRAETRVLEGSPDLKGQADEIDVQVAAKQEEARKIAAERKRVLSTADPELGLAIAKLDERSRPAGAATDRAQLARERVELMRSIAEKERRLLADKPELRKQCEALQARIEALHAEMTALRQRKRDLLKTADAELAQKHGQLTAIETRIAELAQQPRTETEDLKQGEK